MRLAMTLSAMVLVSAAGEAWASGTGPRQIRSIGCHLVDNTCFVEISGGIVGPTGCQSTSLRWNQKEDANGQSILALLTAAFQSGKTVSFEIRDTACYVYQPVFPTFAYIFVH
ncbi:hypothetical protein [Stigmatella aurantiaca]|uniref:hypothetical protein n=1 Tax=Stigmatella aurantiaca TaxID=41 RepID=UPI000942D1FA|nr:hypothetical protein [Stigmatella aurantiaca]